MRKIGYSGNLKKDIELMRGNFIFSKISRKKLLRVLINSTVLGLGVGLLNPLLGYITFSSVVLGNLGFNIFKKEKERKSFISKQEEALKRMKDLTLEMSRKNLDISVKCLSESVVSKDFITYKNNKGEEFKEEIRNYYIKDISGEVLFLTEMRKEIASLIDKKKINASLEITDGYSDFISDSSYGLYLMDGSEYEEVESKKTLALTIR